MNIGVFFKHRESGGGIYQYCLTIIEALLKTEHEHKIFVFYRWVIPSINKKRIRAIKLEKKCGLADSSRSNYFCREHEVIWKGSKITFRDHSLSFELRNAAVNCNIDLMLFPTPEREAFETNIPYIMAVHDVAHKTLPAFPEFSENGIFDQREYVFTEGTRNAASVLVESETGRNQLLTHYDMKPDKITVLPFIPPLYLLEGTSRKQELKCNELRATIPSSYLFFPAQFWPHKNHANLIKALSIVKRKHGFDPAVVFTGTNDDFGVLPELKHMARKYGVLDQIVWKGYVEPYCMRGLYESALALIMPTFLGPANIPILEAFATGCPVIASDIPGFYELTKDAALLVNPEDHEDIADAIVRIVSDADLRSNLTEKGRLAIENRSMDNFSSRLTSIIGGIC